MHSLCELFLNHLGLVWDKAEVSIYLENVCFVGLYLRALPTNYFFIF